MGSAARRRADCRPALDAPRRAGAADTRIADSLARRLPSIATRRPPAQPPSCHQASTCSAPLLSIATRRPPAQRPSWPPLVVCSSRPCDRSAARAPPLPRSPSSDAASASTRTSLEECPPCAPEKSSLAIACHRLPFITIACHRLRLLAIAFHRLPLIAIACPCLPSLAIACHRLPLIAIACHRMPSLCII